MKAWYGAGCLLLAGALAACGGGAGDGDDGAKANPTATLSEFSKPERVTLLGYTGQAMEPFISPDGSFLLFNNSNAVTANTNLQYAERIDDLTFQYRGPILGANTGALDGVPSMDSSGKLYFISLRDAQATQATLYRGQFTNGTMSNVEAVQGIAQTGFGMLDFDAGVSFDGNQIYIAEGQFIFLSFPLSANIVLAQRQGAGFVPAANSDQIMREVNVGNISYAPAISRSGLEIFFTRIDGGTSYIYTAARSATSEPFGVARRITSIDGVAEGPALSPDERSLYYHRRDGGQFVIYRVTRR